MSAAAPPAGFPPGPPISGELLVFAPDSDDPGWYAAPAATTGRFIDTYGAIRARAEDAATARLRFTPTDRHRNLIGTLHGGFTMAVVDQALFLGPSVLGVRRMRGAFTVEASTMFFATLAADRPFDAVVELLRETGRMVFVRGLIEQDGTRAVAFSGTVRKASEQAPA